MERNKLDQTFASNEKHAQWEMSANIGSVKLSALCVTEEHREKTLKHWCKMKAQNIQLFERADAPKMLTWKVSVPTTRKGEIRLTMTASTEDSVRSQLSGMKYAKWQQWQAKIEQVQEEVKQPELLEVIEQPKEEIAPVTIEQTTAPIEQEEIKPEQHRYKASKKFATRMRQAFMNKRNYIKDLDSGSLERRLEIIQEKIERNCRTDIYGENAIPRAYDPAAYGLLWTVKRGTVNGETYNALRAMTTMQLCELIHTMLVECGEGAGDYAQWLMKRFKPAAIEQPAATTQEEASQQPACEEKQDEFSPNLSPIESTQSVPDPIAKNCMQIYHKLLDTKINIHYNTGIENNLDYTKGDTKMNQVMAEPTIQLSGEQEALFNIMDKSHQHMFITGRAGTGKSVLLRHFRNNTSKRIVVAAPTGIAALNVRGQTLHSLFKLPTKLFTPKSLDPNPRACTLLRKIECLVIDEISMVRADIIDAIDERLREAFKTEEPFGGVQLIMFGDVYQLPPVVERDLAAHFERVHKGHFFFNALAWKRAADFKIYELTQVFRQKDPVFKDVLNAVRDGSVVDSQLNHLNTRYGVEVPTEGVITLAPTNALVSMLNQKRLEQLPGKPRQYRASITGTMKQGAFPTEEILDLKEGAQVVMLKNDRDGRWVNGTVGKVEELHDDHIDISIGGIPYTVDKETWEEIAYRYNEDTDEMESSIVSTFTQYPVRLAFALTIHKSQGQTYEQVALDLSMKTFAPGQMYVALSRCTSLEGLYLNRQVKPDFVIVDTKVKMFMSNVETIKIEVPPVIVEAEQIVQSLQIQPLEAQEEAITPESEEEIPTGAKKGRKAKAENEKVVKLDVRLDPMIREGLARLMAKIEETTAEERAKMVPHSTHKVPTISDVVMEALLNLPAFREVNPDLEADYEGKRSK